MNSLSLSPSSIRISFLAIFFGFQCWALATDVISIEKPISESLKPDGIYWNFDNGKLDDSDPNPTKDQSGNEYDGFLLPGANGITPVYTKGRFGTGVSLPGSDPQEMDPRVSWNAAENPGSNETRLDLDGKSFTAGAWIKFNEPKPGETETFVVMERGYTSATNSAWQLTVTKAASDEGALQFSVPEAYQRSATNFEISFSDGEWHHVAVAFEATDTGSRVTLWFDGRALVEDAMMNGAVTPVEGSGRNRLFTVGERNDHYHYSNSNVSVDEVFVTSGIYRFEP